MSGIWSDTARRLKSSPLALAAAGFIVAVALVSIVGPLVDSNRFDTLDWSNIAVAPGVLLAILLLSFNIFGDCLRDALDTEER